MTGYLMNSNIWQGDSGGNIIRLSRESEIELPGNQKHEEEKEARSSTTAGLNGQTSLFLSDTLSDQTNGPVVAPLLSRPAHR